MSTCLRVVTDVWMRIQPETLHVGDLLFTDEGAYLIPYAVWDTSGGLFGKYALGGLLTGGLVGALVGHQIDSAAEALKPRTSKAIKDLDEVKRFTYHTRSQDYGRTVEDRLLRHGGVVLKQSAAFSVTSNHWLQTQLAPDATACVRAENDTDTDGLLATLQKWQSGGLEPRPTKELQGATIGVALSELIEALEAQRDSSLPDTVIQKIAADREYIDKFVTAFFAIKKVRREWATRWLQSAGSPLLSIIVAHLQKAVVRISRRLKRLWCFGAAIAAALVVAKFILSWSNEILFLPGLVIFIAAWWTLIDGATWVQTSRRLRSLSGA